MPLVRISERTKAKDSPTKQLAIAMVHRTYHTTIASLRCRLDSMFDASVVWNVSRGTTFEIQQYPPLPFVPLVSEAHSEANTPDRCHMAPSKTLEAAPTTLADLLYGCAPLLCRDVSDALRNLPQPVHGYPVRMTLGGPVLSLCVIMR